MERKLTLIQQIVNHYFFSLGLDLEEIKEQAKNGEINYPRHTRSAQQLLELAGSIEKAKESIDKLAKWADSNSLEYTLDTVIKKWLEIESGKI